MRYTLRHREGTETFQRIYTGRKWVGRVAQHKDGKRYLGIIGRITVYRPTAIEAFEEVSALAMGFKSAADLKAQNVVARQRQRTVRQNARHVVTEMLRGNFEPLDRALGFRREKS